MNSYFIFAIALTVIYIIYYAFMIFRDLNSQKGERCDDVEIFTVDPKDADESIDVTESESGFNIGKEEYTTEYLEADSESPPETEEKAADAQPKSQAIEKLKSLAEEASRFGIMNVKNEDEIYEFEEKPAHPKSTLASMGIYIFNWKVLKKALMEDEKNENSSNDFGKDIIPKLLGEGKKLIAYPFEGYWKDVGTVESLWEANMDLLGEKPKFDIFDKNWRIYSKSTNQPSQVIGDKAVIENSLVTEGCVINGTVENSILFQGVVVEKGAVVKDSVVMCDSIIKKDGSVLRAICGRHVVVEAGKKITGNEEIALIEEDRIVNEDVIK